MSPETLAPTISQSHDGRMARHPLLLTYLSLLKKLLCSQCSLTVILLNEYWLLDLLDLRPLRLRRTLRRPEHQFPPLLSVLCDSAGLDVCDISVLTILLYCVCPFLLRSSSWPIPMDPTVQYPCWDPLWLHPVYVPKVGKPSPSDCLHHITLDFKPCLDLLVSPSVPQTESVLGTDGLIDWLIDWQCAHDSSVTRRTYGASPAIYLLT